MAATSAVVLLNCSNAGMMAGTITQSGNGMVSGCVLNETGKPVSHAVVSIVPAAYDPVSDAALPGRMIDTTDSAGNYRLAGLSQGKYNVYATYDNAQKVLLIKNIILGNDSVVVLPADLLQNAGQIKVFVSPSMNETKGYLYIPGTTIYALLRDNTGSVMLSHVPAGVTDGLMYSETGGTFIPRTVAGNIVVNPGAVTPLANTDWKFSRKISLNTTASGANVSGDVTEFPVLVRLTGGNFNFSQTMSRGEDIRFTKSDGSPLSYEIERWDATQSLAEIWVRVDTVYGSDSTHFITMFWGNPNAVSESNGAAVFDTTGGFQGVWHLSEPQGSFTYDATANRFNGLASDTAPLSAQGTIGLGMHFNGINSRFTVTGSETGKLNFPAHAAYTISAWVYADTLDSSWHDIVAKGNTQYQLQIQNSNQWLFAEYEDHAGWEQSTAPASAREWLLVTGVRDNDRQYLYVNGACVDSSPALNPYSDSLRYQGNPVTIGSTMFQDAHLNYFFKGTIDEARICNCALPPVWIRLCYMNQKQNDALAVFK
jgi:hypothetical protein